MRNILIIRYLCCLLAVGVLLEANANGITTVDLGNSITTLSDVEINPTISASNGCDCNNSANYQADNIYHFAETILIQGDPGDTWTLSMDFSVGLTDASGNYMSGPVVFTETSPGVYTLNFWHKQATGYGIYAFNSAGSFLSINDICYDYCNSSCSLNDGLIVNDCVSDDRFTFTLNPSGSDFSGTYNVVGDVVSYGVTGTYTSPPILSTEGDINITIVDSKNLSCGTTLDIPPPACAALSFFALNSCDCDIADNYQLNGTYYFAETVAILGDMEDTWTVDMDYSVGLYDNSGNLMTAPLMFTETQSGIYELSFWHKLNSGYGVHTYNSAGEYGSLNNVCQTPCPSLCSIDNDGLIINECLPDDRFTFTLNPSGAGFSGTYNLSGDINRTGLTGSYTSPPALSDVGNLNVTITDATDPTCSYTVYISPPACASEPCSIDDFGLTVGSCTVADRFIFTLNPSGLGFSGTYHMSGDVNIWNQTGTYTSPPAFTHVGDINVTITDAANPYCKATVYITPPDCSVNTCSIDDFGLIVNECRPDGTFTFSVNPSGSGFSGMYNISGDANATGVIGTYNSIPASTDNDFLSVLVTDRNDPSCSRMLYIPTPECPVIPDCAISDYGLVINDCTPDNRFTFDLNPSGLGFSGTYHMSGDVNVWNQTGNYTSPPALTNVGDINVTITDAADPSCKVTVYIPPPQCDPLDPIILSPNSCDCNNADNFEANGSKFLAEKLDIIGEAGDTWTVDFAYSAKLYDASGRSINSATFTETSSGVYELDFWHKLGTKYDVQAYNSAGEYLSFNNTCITSCARFSNDNLRKSPDVEGVAIAEIFPNPGNGIINIRFDSNTNYDANIVVMDLYGKKWMVSTISTNPGANLANIDSSELPAGSYFILLESDNWRTTPKRFVKVK